MQVPHYVDLISGAQIGDLMSAISGLPFTANFAQAFSNFLQFTGMLMKKSPNMSF